MAIELCIPGSKTDLPWSRTVLHDWEKVARVHGDIFSDIKPVSTLVEVSGLIDEELLIEIEVSAVVSSRI